MTIEPIKEKLDDKISKLNSTRVIKKITPRYDLSWYIKWTGSLFLIVAMMMTSANVFPLNLYSERAHAAIAPKSSTKNNVIIVTTAEL